MKNISMTIINWLIKYNVISKDEYELYAYAMNSFIMSVLPIVIAGIIGAYMGSSWLGIAVVFPFALIRKFSGGYHMKNKRVCLVCSLLVLFLSISLAFGISNAEREIMLVTIISAISLMKFSPLENENKPLSVEEKISYRQKTQIIVFCILMFDFLLFQFGPDRPFYCISVGIQLAASLQMPVIFKMTKNNNKMSFQFQSIEMIAKK